MSWVEAKGVRYFYRVLNNSGKKTVVMLHGLFSNHTLYYRLGATDLANAGYRVVMPDLRGHGLSDSSERGFTVNEMAEDVLDLMDALGIGQTAIVGYSWGGSIAIQALIDQPERFWSTVLIEPSGLVEEDLELINFEEGGVDNYLDDYASTTRIPVNDRERVLFKARVEVFRKRGLMEAMRADCDYLVNADLGSIHCPAIVLGGKQSILLADAKLAAQRIEGSRFVMTEGNHYFPMIQTKWVKKQLVGFILNTEKQIGADHRRGVQVSQAW
ncbi:MAG: alpha/beta hydrolase [Propionibacteriaceae bacterium]|nr:alpha/beta hydrolase [Propionibacteriaceae bacterium]